MTWIRWQIACLADDIRNIRRRLHHWYVGTPGRHSYDTAQMLAIEADLATRPWPADLEYWPLDAAPALETQPPLGIPASGPELPPDDPPWVAEAQLRGFSPHVYAPDPDYWTYAWWAFDQDGTELRDRELAAANQLRRDCGLPPRPHAPPQIRELKAA